MSENKNVTQKSGVPGNVANALSNLINSEAEKNKDKVSANNRRYWERKALARKAAEQEAK